MKINGKRNLTIRIRVSPEEKQVLIKRAGGQGKLSQYVRDAAIQPKKM